MLKELNADQARFVALLAKAVRAQRDSLLGNVAEDDLAKELKLSWGEHNSTGRVGAALALREAVATCRRWRVPYLISSCIIGQEDLSAENSIAV